MIKTIASIFITLGIIFGLAFYENNRVNNTFREFETVLTSLYNKTESGEVTYEDGTATERFWENKKNTLHIWLPHTAILEIDYQLYEAVGYLYVRDYQSALPKIEILLGMCENIPQSYRFSIENVL
ncbi:MAG: DUF4363 family protein [Clostridia bacterium]|nr:DUF4363 family protein [Clostridia bacterium]